VKPVTPWRSLRVALVLSHIAVAVVAMAALLATAELSSSAFYRAHLDTMARTYGGAQPDAMHAELQRGVASALDRALLVGLAVGVPLALLVGAWAARRVLRPVSRVSEAARQIASGGYRERLPHSPGDELDGLIGEFNRLAASLEATEARRAELINTIAHELRTPLVGVQGYAEGLGDGVFTPREAAERIGREVARLKKLVDDLSEVSRVEGGALGLTLEPVNLGAAVADTVERFAPLFEGRLTLEPSKRTLTVRADLDRVAQVLVNLLANASRHAPGARVVVRVLERRGAAHVEVEDRGPGIAPEHAERVFERFYRADPARTAGGTGVGLTISRALAVAMGGSLTVEPNTPHGARFVFALSLCEQQNGQ
jgi:histidine kinase